jgi:hypothetical protein
LTEAIGSPTELIGVRFQLLLLILFDAIFLLAWRAIGWGFDWLKHLFGGADDIDWTIGRWVFSSSTLLLIFMYLFWDFLRAWAVLHRQYTDYKKRV